MLTAVVIKQSHQIGTLNEKISAMQRNQHRPNVFVSGIIESENENDEQRAEKIKSFFKNQMEIEDEIPISKSFRVGNSTSRALKIVLSNPADKGTIFSNAKNLKGKSNAKRRLFYVNDDSSEEEREFRKYYQSLKKENSEKEDEQQLTITLKRGKLRINNSVVKNKLQPPNIVDILTLSDEEIEHIHQVKTYSAGEHEEAGSDFMCYFQRVSSVEEVQQGLAKIKIKHGDATHIATAYRLEDPVGPYRQEFFDDGEFGAGRRMLDVMKSEEQVKMAVYIPRYHGGENMGKRRFEIYEMLTKKAVGILKQKLARLSRINRQRRSGSQLSQLSQSSMDDVPEVEASQEELTTDQEPEHHG